MLMINVIANWILLDASVSHQFLSVRLHNLLSNEQKQCIFKHIASFATQKVKLTTREMLY